MPITSTLVVDEDLIRRFERGEVPESFKFVEITPPRLTLAIEDFCREIGKQVPILVERTRHNRKDNIHPSIQVARQVAEHGGTPLHGWVIRCVPGLWVSAKFHVVWISPVGSTIDISMGEDEEDANTHTMFLPVANSATSADPTEWPDSRRERTMVSDDERACSSAFIGQLSAIDRERYQAFAQENGLSVGQVVRTAMKMGGPIGRRIDALLKERAALDALVLISEEGLPLLRDPNRAHEYRRRCFAVARMEEYITKWATKLLRRAASDGAFSIT